MNTDESAHQDLEVLRGLLADPAAPVDPAWVDAMEARCPCFTLPRALLLSRDSSLSHADREAAQGRLALRLTDKEAFMAMTDSDEAAMAQFYPAPPKAAPISTDNAIDIFLDRYGHTTPEDEALLEKLIFNPVAEYAGVLAAEEAGNPAPAAPADRQSMLIDAFLTREKPAPEAAAEQTDEAAAEQAPEEPAREAAHKRTGEPPKHGSLSESLARIFIRQGRYAKAYEILLNLSLNYPQKSIYFADQLRFLRKLMINQQQKQP